MPGNCHDATGAARRWEHNCGAHLRRACGVAAWLFLAILWISLPAIAEDWVGQPGLTRYTPADTDANPYSFAVLPLASGEIFIGNSNGLLRYFGRHWQHIPMPGGGAARSLALGRDGRIYVGGYQHFGVLDRADDGRYSFSSLDRLFFPESEGAPLGEVWDTIATSQGIYFVTSEQVFLVGDDGQRETFDLPEKLQAAFALGDSVVVALDDHQVYRLGKSGLIPWFRASTGLRGLLPTGDDQYLMLTTQGSMFRVAGDQLTAVPSVAETVMRDGGPYVMIGLPDGDFAVGMLNGNILRLSADLSEFTDWPTGPAPVIAMAVDRENHLWAATEADIVRLSLSDAWSLIDRSNGLRGPVTHAAEYRGRLYVATSVGLFGASREPDGSLRFDLLALGSKEVNNLAATSAGLLVAARDGIYLWRDQQLQTVVSDVLGWRLFPSRVVKGRVYAIEDAGLLVLDPGADRFMVTQQFSDPSYRFDEISEAADGAIWIDRFLAGPMHFAMSGDGSRLAEPVAASLDVESGTDLTAAILDLDGSALVSTDQRLYGWDGSRFRAMTEHPLISVGIAPSSDLRVRGCADGSVYAFTPRRLFRRDADASHAFEELHPMAGGTRGIVDVQCSVAEGPVWIGTWNGMVRFDPRAPRAPLEREAPRMESIRGDVDGSAIQWYPLMPGKLVLDSFRQLRFEYASPAIATGLRYQSRLHGYDQDWIDSGGEGVRAFSTLAPGSYRFEARSLDQGSVPGPALAYIFTVRPQWYQTVWARLAGMIGLILLVSGLLRWRSHRLERRNQELEKLVSERTNTLAQRSAQLEQANKRLSELADLDGLTGVANRRKLENELEDAWSAARASDGHLSMLLIDVDHFKQFNDTYGHSLGDERLKSIAERLSGWVGPGELLARYGGEEFVLLMPGSSLDVALERADAIRRDARHAGQDGTRSSISIGIAERLKHQPVDQGQLFEYADLALYRAKNAGRDRVEVYTD